MLGIPTRLGVALLALGALAGCGTSTGTTHAEFVTKADAVCRSADSQEHSFEARLQRQSTYAGIAEVLQAQASWVRNQVDHLAAVKVDEADQPLASKWIAALRTTLAKDEQFVSLVAKLPGGPRTTGSTAAEEALGGSFIEKEHAIENAASRAEGEYKALSKTLGLRVCGTK